MTQALKRDIDEIVSQLITHYKPEKIILFGSAARGDMNEDSDLDFFILKKGVDDIGPNKRYQEVMKYIPATVAVDAFVYTPYELKKRLFLGDPFVRAVFREGKVLYGA